MAKIKTALVSVYCKDGIVDFVDFLLSKGVKIISTGGTYALLKENGLDVTGISDLTSFPEIMSGRLKTLHPMVHGGLLGTESDQEVMQKMGIERIDLLVVNLYPFEETVKSKESTFDDIVEKIDIGGPAMIRSASKNFNHVSCIVDPDDYPEFTEQLKEGDMKTSLDFRKKLASKAFDLTAYYDAVIAKWFNENPYDKKYCSIPLSGLNKPRYGENPHQSSAVFSLPSIHANDDSEAGVINAKQLQGKTMSYNNIVDADAAVDGALLFGKGAVVVVKHASPCGLAVDNDLMKAYEKALSCDKTSAFGGIIAVTSEICGEVAELMSKHFYEVVIAPSFSDDARKILEKKKNLRLLTMSTSLPESYTGKFVSGGVLIQDTDNKPILADDLEIENKEGELNLDNFVFAMNCVRLLKSNAITICLDNAMISYCGGQTSRIDATNIACKKLQSDVKNLENAVLASDAFFPFADNIETIAKYGIKNVVAPKGSIRDEEVIKACKKFKINLVFAKTRHFKH